MMSPVIHSIFHREAVRSHNSIVVVLRIKSILLCVVIVSIYLEMHIRIVPSIYDFEPGYV